MPTLTIPTAEQWANPLTLDERQTRVIWSVYTQPESTPAHIRGNLREHLPIKFGDADAGKLEAIMRWVISLDLDVIIPGDEHWPAGLDDLEHPPTLLYTKGATRNLVEATRIAVVGTRAATGYGEYATMNLASAIVDHGGVVISGLAFGIDAMAHRAALSAAMPFRDEYRPSTIAVMGGGLDRAYPSDHQNLFDRIADHALVVSEYPPGTPPTKNRFLQRNRIIGAISQGLVVVEAGYRSGSTNAARQAGEIGRPVMAYPGPITSAASDGCHRFIREGKAVLVTSYTEVAETILEHGTKITAKKQGIERLARTLMAHTGAPEEEQLGNYLADAAELAQSMPHLLSAYENGIS